MVDRNRFSRVLAVFQMFIRIKNLIKSKEMGKKPQKVLALSRQTNLFLIWVKVTGSDGEEECVWK